MAGTRISSHWWQELEALHTKQVAGCFVLLKQVAGTRISSHWWQELEAPYTKQVAGWTARLVSCKRAMVSDQLASETVVVEKTVANPEAMAGIFSEKQMNELLFCDQKKLKSQVESLLLGVLVPADVTPELINQALEHVVKFRKNQRERLREQANVQKRTSRKTVSRLISTKCLCDESGWGDLICDTFWYYLPFLYHAFFAR